MSDTDGVSAPLKVDVDSGSAMWVSTESAPVTAVSVELTDSVTVVVDVATPERVLAWTLVPGADPNELRMIFTEDTCAAAVIAALAGSTPPELPVPRLSPPWARLAEVSAVDQALPAGLDEDILDLDEAMARAVIGQTGVAAALFALNYTTLLELAEQALAGAFDDYTTDRIRQMLGTAIETNFDGDLAQTLMPLRDQLDAEHAARKRANDAEFAARFDQLVDEHLATIGGRTGSDATDLGSGSTEMDIDTGIAPVDLNVVPTRLLRWDGPNHHELTYRFDPKAQRLQIEAALADDIVPDHDTAESLMVYITDTVTCQVLVCVPTTVRGRTVFAEFTFPSWDRNRHRVGIFDSDNSVADLRTGLLGRTEAQVTRLMRESWSTLRQADEVLVYARLSDSPGLVEKGEARYRMLLRRARQNAQQAITVLQDVTALPDIDESVRRKIAGNAAVIERYLDGLRPGSPRPLTEPLLAEIIRKKS